MDIDLLSRMVKELILDSDEVSLPGVGSFVAELVPSTFSDKGYTINPPYRRLYFRGRQDSSDTSLARLYAAGNGVEFKDAERIINSFLAELKEVLLQKKTIVFPGLGRLRATKENNFFFVPDEDLDIYPAGLGLEPVSLKNHEETSEEVSQALDGFKAIIDSTAPAEEVQEEVASDAFASEPEVPTEAEEGVHAVPAVAVPEAPAEVAPAVMTAAVPEAEAKVPDKQEYTSPAADVQPQPAPEQPVAQDTGIPLEPVAVPAPEEQPAESLAPIEEPAPEEAPVVTAPASEEVPAPKRKGTFWKVLLIIILSIAVLAILALVAFLIAARIAPDWIDSLLYTPDQLEILHGRLPL